MEATYPVEKGRLAEPTFRALASALGDPKKNLVIYPLNALVTRAVSRIPRDEVPDLPDRVIAATAFALGLPLVTRDAKIRASCIETMW